MKSLTRSSLVAVMTVSLVLQSSLAFAQMRPGGGEHHDGGGMGGGQHQGGGEQHQGGFGGGDHHQNPAPVAQAPAPQQQHQNWGGGQRQERHDGGGDAGTALAIGAGVGLLFGLIGAAVESSRQEEAARAQEASRAQERAILNAEAKAFRAAVGTRVRFGNSSVITSNEHHRGSDLCRNYRLSLEDGSSDSGVLCRNSSDGSLYEAN